MPLPVPPPVFSGWHTSVIAAVAELRTLLDGVPAAFLPSKIAEAIEEVDHACLRIEGELGDIGRRLTQADEDATDSNWMRQQERAL